jgi:hypothetical protein
LKTKLEKLPCQSLNLHTQVSIVGIHWPFFKYKHGARVSIYKIRNFKNARCTMEMETFVKAKVNVLGLVIHRTLHSYARMSTDSK